MLVHQNTFTINTDPQKLDIPLIHKFLSEESYWAKNVPYEIVARAINNSLCFGLYQQDTQIGFARVITDRASFAYLADVFIIPRFRGQGLSKWLVQNILAHPELQGLRRWMLATSDAHGLYSQFGFSAIQNPEPFMHIHNPDIYQTLNKQ
ncbi:GNAT family N-acetyltransferase [Chitinophaga pendula]|uniref:GNAT family N-acetyltransferase n=1 Tax=Chitinophaga TaxID=79328 RepID=UPI000BAEA53B|nr:MULTISPECIES: GNAT family N-acetyltransferase [Chitinophaga]ASZ11794.1 GNAT family N-acetyltransferase [Chitinophaga sp. MD30]UCJ05186.1 GNAT family N-acetyltransferase [Chitinophaga pendula]